MLTRKEIRELQDEAMQAHAAFRDARKLLLENPDNAELRAEKDRCRTHFQELERKIEGAIAERKTRTGSADGHDSEAPDDLRETAEAEDVDNSDELALDLTTTRRPEPTDDGDADDAESRAKLRPDETADDSDAMDETAPAAPSMALDDSANWIVPTNEPVDPEVFNVPDRKYYEPILVGPRGFLPVLVAESVARFKRHPLLHIFAVAAVVVGSFAMLKYVWNVELYRVQSDAMQPTLEPGDLVVLWGAAAPAHGDVVAMQDPLAAETLIVRRIVAMGDDAVEVRRERLRVNDKPVLETYLAEPMEYDFLPMQIGPDEVFVLGDNRNEATDGHSWGYGVPQSSIGTNVQFIIYPFSRWGRLESHRRTFLHVSAPRPLDRGAPPH